MTFTGPSDRKLETTSPTIANDVPAGRFFTTAWTVEAPEGTDTGVCDLTLETTCRSPANGWGPVERNTNNGESAAGDGKPITIVGVEYEKGIGVNAHSVVD